MKKLSKNQGIIIMGVLFLALIVAILIAIYHNTHTSPKEVNRELKQYAKKHHIPSQGDKDAKHKMYVFTDFQCSHCYKYHENEYQEVVKPMIEKGNVEYTEIHLPVINHRSHQFAQMTRAISNTGHNDSFYQYSNEAYQHQGIDKDPVTVLKRLHLDKKDEQDIIDAYRKHEDDEIDKKEIKNKFNAESTPTVFIDGKPITKTKDIKTKLEK